jgi:hypothetical protein
VLILITSSEGRHLPLVYLFFFLLLWDDLGTEAAKLDCFITYNNMGSKTLSMECTFASLIRLKEKTLKDMLAFRSQGKV